jgi:hypothetical protein
MTGLTRTFRRRLRRAPHEERAIEATPATAGDVKGGAGATRTSVTDDAPAVGAGTDAAATATPPSAARARFSGPSRRDGTPNVCTTPIATTTRPLTTRARRRSECSATV